MSHESVQLRLGGMDYRDAGVDSSTILEAGRGSNQLRNGGESLKWLSDDGVEEVSPTRKPETAREIVKGTQSHGVIGS